MYHIQAKLSQENQSETIIINNTSSTLQELIANLETLREQSVQILNEKVAQDKLKTKSKSEQNLQQDNEDDVMGEDIDDEDLDQAAVRIQQQSNNDAVSEPDTKKQRI